MGLKGYWLRNPVRDEAEFRVQMQWFVGQVRALLLRGDVERAGEVRRCFAEAEVYCSMEPLATVYNQGMILIALLYASYGALIRDWKWAYRCAAQARRLIAECNEHRLRHGREVRPFSEALWSGHRILADVKWQGAEEDRERLMTPEQIIEEHLEISARVRPRLGDYPGGEEKAGRLRDSLAWSTLAVIKMATRFLPLLRVAKLVAHFDQTFGASLRCGAGHFRALKGAPFGRALWYWDYELCKLWLAGQLVIEDLDLLHRERVQALEADGCAQPLDRRALESEYAWLYRQCHRRLEVVSA